MPWSAPVPSTEVGFTYYVNYSVPGSDIAIRFNGNVDFADAEFSSYIDALASLPFVSNIVATKYDVDNSTDTSQYMP